MKFGVYFTLLFIFMCCNNKIVYQNNKIVVTKKELYSKWIYLDSGYGNILKSQTWNLVFYSKEHKRKVYIVDSNLISFKFINDSLIRYFISNDSFQLIASKYKEYHHVGLIDTGEFKIFDETFLVLRTDSVVHSTYLKVVHPKILIINIQKNKRHTSRRGKQYKLCFQAAYQKK